MGDDAGSTTDGSWADALRRLRELSAQVTAAAQTAALAGARATPPVWAQPLARYTSQLLTVNAAITTPMRRLLEEQEQLVTKMADWAEQHRQMSEQIAEWAAQQRRLSEELVDLARPFLDQSAMLESLQAGWNDRSPDSEGPSPRPSKTVKRTPAKRTPTKASPRSR